MLSSHGGVLPIAVHYHGETIKTKFSCTAWADSENSVRGRDLTTALRTSLKKQLDQKGPIAS